MKNNFLIVAIVGCIAMLFAGCAKEEPKEELTVSLSTTLKKDGNWRIWIEGGQSKFKCDVIGNTCKLNSGLVIGLNEELQETYFPGLTLEEIEVEDPASNQDLLDFLAEEEDYYISYVKNGTWRIWIVGGEVEMRCDVIGNKCKLNSGLVVALGQTELDLFFPEMEIEEIELEDPENNIALLNYLDEQEEAYFFE